MKLVHTFGAFVASLLLSQTIAESITAIAVFNDTKCSSSPTIVAYIPDKNCTEGDIICSSNDDGESGPHVNQSCTTDPSGHAKSAFGESQYLLMEVYGDDCKDMTFAVAMVADGSCQITPDTNTSSKVSVEGSNVTISLYTDSSCKNLESALTVKSANNGSCDDKIKFYTNVAGAGSGGNGGNNQGSGASHYSPTFWLTSIAATAVVIATLL